MSINFQAISVSRVIRVGATAMALSCGAFFCAPHVFAVSKDVEAQALSITKRAEGLCTAGEAEQAVDNCNKAIKLDPELAAPHYWLACAYADLQKNDQAFKEFRTASVLQSGAYAYLAMIKAWKVHSGLKEYVKALDDLDFLLKCDPRASKTRICIDKGYTYLDMRNYPEGLKAVNEALAVNHDYPDALALKALLLSKSNKTDEAIKVYGDAFAAQTKALAARPLTGKNPSYLLRERAALYKKVGKNDLAAKDLRRATELDTDDMDMIPFRMK